MHTEQDKGATSSDGAGPTTESNQRQRGASEGKREREDKDWFSIYTCTTAKTQKTDRQTALLTDAAPPHASTQGQRHGQCNISCNLTFRFLPPYRERGGERDRDRDGDGDGDRQSRESNREGASVALALVAAAPFVAAPWTAPPLVAPPFAAPPLTAPPLLTAAGLVEEAPLAPVLGLLADDAAC